MELGAHGDREYFYSGSFYRHTWLSVIEAFTFAKHIQQKDIYIDCVCMHLRQWGVCVCVYVYQSICHCASGNACPQWLLTAAAV